MRFDTSTGFTAYDLIQTASADELRAIFYEYADEPKARFIAEAIVAERQCRDISTTFALRDIIRASSFDKKSPIRVFQALRIAVNDEFMHIRQSFKYALDRLRIGGRIAVITFHSIEDRMVKHFFLPYTQAIRDEVTGQDRVPAKLKKVYRKPIVPAQEEVQRNPRSRSAKLRIFERIS